MSVVTLAFFVVQSLFKKSNNLHKILFSPSPLYVTVYNIYYEYIIYKWGVVLNVFLSVWTKTRATVRYMIDHKSMALAFMLYILGGIGSVMTGLTDIDLTFSVPIILLICFIGGPLLLSILQFVVAAVVLLMGKLFKGTGRYTDIFKALSVGYIPFIVLIPFYTIWLLVDTEGLLMMNVEPNAVISIITLLLTAVMSIYSIVIQIIAVSEAHRFGIWKAIFTLFIPGILLILILLVFLVVILAIFVGSAL